MRTANCALSSATFCRWSDELGRFLTGMTTHLIRRRLVEQAQPDFPGVAAVTLSSDDLKPIARTLMSLALPAMYHKSATLRTSALDALVNCVYVLPQEVLSLSLQRFWEAMEASNSVHQISSSIRFVASTHSLLVAWL